VSFVRFRAPLQLVTGGHQNWRATALSPKKRPQSSRGMEENDEMVDLIKNWVVKLFLSNAMSQNR
jgi:hypothetical protein